MRIWPLLLILLVSCSSPPQITFGVLSDIHGHPEHATYFVHEFSNVDGIIIAGDIAQHSRDKPHNLTDYEEIYQSLEEAAKIGIPVYVIPGNHEMPRYYEDAISELNKTNIIDMLKKRTIELENIVLVSNPYGTDFTYGPEGYRASEKDMQELDKLLKQDKQILLISHQPPKSKGKDCIDVVYNGDNVGDEDLDKLMKEHNVKFSISGHIHEAGGRACTSSGELVKENEWSDDMRFNPGAASPWKYLDGRQITARAGILTIQGNKAKYEILEKV